jgi:diacylglycerol kinase (ATP)
MAIGVVFNPRAGANRRDPDGPARLRDVLGADGLVRAPGSREELGAVAAEFLSRGVKVLAIAGGDGTHHVTLTGFARVYGDRPLPAVALVRGGTMNTVADSLAIPRESAAKRLARIAADLRAERLETAPQGTLSVDGAVGFLWGLGVVPTFLQAYYETGAPSPVTAARTLGRGIASTLTRGTMYQRLREGVRCEVTHDEGVWASRDWLTVAAGTIADIGLGFRPFHRAPGALGRIHLLGVRTSPLGFVLDLPRIHRAMPMREDKAVDALVSRFTVRAEGAPLRYMIDGDVLEHPGAEMTVTTGPVLQIVR